MEKKIKKKRKKKREKKRKSETDPGKRLLLKAKENCLINLTFD